MRNGEKVPTWQASILATASPMKLRKNTTAPCSTLAKTSPGPTSRARFEFPAGAVSHPSVAACTREPDRGSAQEPIGAGDGNLACRSKSVWPTPFLSQNCPRLNRLLRDQADGGASRFGGFAMGKIKQDRIEVPLRGADNVLQLRAEQALLRGAGPPRRATLREENARLRRLAIGLSNLLGDLPPLER